MRSNSSNRPINRHSAVQFSDFLRRDNKMAALLQAAERMASLQRDCAAALPGMFKYCEILAFEDCLLTLALPNASLVARLKQQIPRMQTTLSECGWQVHDIKLKVRMAKPAEAKEKMRALSLPEAAVTAFDELVAKLDDTTPNAKLITALRAMVARRRPG